MQRLAWMVVILCAACSRTPVETISIGTGGTAGVYYPYGGAMAELWNEHIEGLKVVAEVTGASVENVRLAHKGETVIGEVMGDVAYQAYHGKGLFQGKPQKILTLAVMYPSSFHVVALKGSKGRFKDKTVSIGSPGSGTAVMSDLVLNALGVSKESFAVRRLSFLDTANALKDRSIDVGLWCVAAPTSSIMDLATTHDIRILPFSEEERTSITERHHFYRKSEIPAGVYRGVDEPVPTVGVWNVVICKADLPEDLVHDLAKVLFENNEHMKSVHRAAEHTTPQNTKEHSPIPIHPGTKRYLEEIGLGG
jgi:TRAP transporter TAXI family solute receptor